MSDGVTTRRDGHILEVTLERGKVNAIDVPTSQALAAAFQQLHEDKDLRLSLIHISEPTRRVVSRMPSSA